MSVIAAGVLQGNAEAALIKSQPERFPPAASKYLWEAVAEWRAGKSGKPLLATIKAKFEELDQEKKARGFDGPGANALTNIQVEIATAKRPSEEFRDQQKAQQLSRSQSAAAGVSRAAVSTESVGEAKSTTRSRRWPPSCLWRDRSTGPRLSC